MERERLISGLGCQEVLAKLDRFADGTLDEPDRAAVVAHVSACDRCAQFGEVYLAVVRKIRSATGVEAPDDGVLERLEARLALDRRTGS